MGMCTGQSRTVAASISKFERPKPEIYEALEERGVKYAIRLPANDSLIRDIEEVLTRPAGRPAQRPLVWYKGFLYQAASWKKRDEWSPRWSFMPGNCSHGWASS